MARNWKQDAEEGSGEFLKFKNGTEYVALFVSGPKPHSFEAADGKTVKGWEWQVEVDGEEKTLSVTSKRLLRALAAEDDDDPIIGRYIKIRALGDGMDRQWRVVPANRPTRAKQVEIEETEEDEEVEEVPRKPKKPTGNAVETDSIDEFEAEATRRQRRKSSGKRRPKGDDFDDDEV